MQGRAPTVGIVKLHLEAEPEELREKGDALVAQLAKALERHDPELADRLTKATKPAHNNLKHQALRDLHADLRNAYHKTLDKMLGEINQALDERLQEMETGK